MVAVKTERLRDYRGPVTNTDIWDEFEVRPDDVFVVTPPKCGTTWMLNIVMMLIHGRVVPDAGNRNAAPWLDAGFRDQKAIAASLSAMKRRRCIKSHTPLDGISYGAEPTHIVVYRHPIDVHFSFRSHVDNMKDQEMFANLVPADIKAGFSRFLDGAATDKGTDDLTIASIAHHYMQSKKRQSNGNVHFFHYADLSHDLRGQVARLAAILKIDLSEQILDDIAEANTFSNMRQVAETSERRFHEESPFNDQAKFFESGSSNKWEGKLATETLGRYADRCASLLSPEDAAWLNWGGQQPS